MTQSNFGGTNYQVQTGDKNTNFFDGEHHHHYPQSPIPTEPKRFTVPYPRNDYFTGREAILTQLHETLGQTGTAAISQAKAISGLGGVGKTQTAVEYAYRYFEDDPVYDWVLWVNASNLTLASSFGALATDLALPNHRENKLDENIAAVRRWLETTDRWLLIFDNVDNPQAVKPFRPKTPKGRILITSRVQRLESLGVAGSIELDTMTETEAQDFLRKRTERESIAPTEPHSIAVLAKTLGYLPLALEQAAAYILAKGVSFAAYLRSYETRRLQLLEKEKPQTGDYPDTVATTWTINFEAVQANSAAATDLLRVSAFLAPDNIPYEILILGNDHLGEVLSIALANAFNDELVLPELLEELSRYSLIRLETDDRYSIHRMVQEVLRDTITLEQRQQWMDRTVAALNATFPSLEFKNWWQCNRLLEHVQAIELLSASQTSELGRLLNQAGYFLKKQGRYGEAEPLYLKAIDIYQSRLGNDHPHTATGLNNLAGLYLSQGRYAEAEPLYLKALDIRRLQLGENHPDTATSLNNLAELYRSQGRYAEAEPLFIKALDIYQSRLGDDHADTAWSLNNLAGLYCSQGRYAEAEPLFIKALDIRRSHSGNDHPDTASSLNNLAELYRSQRRYAEAEPLYLQSLDIRRSQLGDTHPDTATSLNNLAGLYDSQGRYSKAEPLYLKALDIRRSQLGQNHPSTASSLNNLALLYYSQRRYAEAEPLFVQALNINRSQLGDTHPSTATSLNNLAALYCSMQRLDEADVLMTQALKILQRHLGSGHPDTIASRQWLAIIRAAKNKGSAID